MITADNFKIICDPVLCPINTVHDYRYFKSARISAPCFTEADLKDVNVWLFTHGHKDHCDFGNLRPIEPHSTIIADASAAKILKKSGYDTSEILSWGDKTQIHSHNGLEITIEAIPAIHGLNKVKGWLVGNCNGYCIEIVRAEKKFSIYASGDTLPNIDTLRALRNRSCDLFIANIGSATVGNGLLGKMIGRITMNLSDVIIMRNCFAAKTIIPIHWDAFEHYQQRDILESYERNNILFVRLGDAVKGL